MAVQTLDPIQVAFINETVRPMIGSTADALDGVMLNVIGGG